VLAGFRVQGLEFRVLVVLTGGLSLSLVVCVCVRVGVCALPVSVSVHLRPLCVVVSVLPKKKELLQRKVLSYGVRVFTTQVTHSIENTFYLSAVVWRPCLHHPGVPCVCVCVCVCVPSL
jgi:hypothetical protein